MSTDMKFPAAVQESNDSRYPSRQQDVMYGKANPKVLEEALATADGY